jgi:hypothetical protein
MKEALLPLKPIVLRSWRPFAWLLAASFFLQPPSFATSYVLLQESALSSSQSYDSIPIDSLVVDSILAAAYDSAWMMQDSVRVDSLQTDSIPSQTIERPRPLDPLPLDRVNPQYTIDQLVKKKIITAHPFIPFVQEIGIGVEVLSLLKNSWNVIKNIRQYSSKRSYTYEASFNVLFRYNIRSVLTLGYATHYPPKLQSNSHAYRAAGWYSSLGFDYLFAYSFQNYFYTGLRYSLASFTNDVLPDDTFRKSLQADWLELRLGAENSLIEKLNLHGGCSLRVAWLNSFKKFPPAENYEIPGYGMTENKVSPSLDIYILYKFSFLERIIKIT